jgi:4-hydroxybenzoate polyprenyltransferase
MRPVSATEPSATAVGARSGRARAALRALRLHQWAKNALVLAPPLLAHRLDAPTLGRAALAFLAFGLVASALYVANDLVDVERDRRHPLKRERPFASRELPAAAGLLLVPPLLGAGALAALALPASFGLLLLGYAATSLAYSIALKRLVALDLVVLAGLYTARLWGGSLATGVPISSWLAAFSMFLFLSLAFLKRAGEIVAMAGESPGRGYRASDAEQVFALGPASGYVSVLVLALYVSSPDVERLYAAPERLWLLCPLALYWLSRIWILARRGEVHGDPVVHALRDPASYAVGALSLLVVWLAS